MKQKTKNLIELHFAVFLFGFAALFGKVIHQNPFVIVLGRTVFASITLFLMIFFSNRSFKLDGKKDYLFLFSVGVIYALHWFTFFKSVQVSNVAIAVLTFSTFPLFVTFLEPYFFNEKIKVFDIVTALIALFGVSLIIPRFDLADNFMQGAIWGILAGFTYAIVAVACRKSIKKYPSSVIAFYQNLSAAIFSLPIVIWFRPQVSLNEFLLLILLGVLFTAFTGILFIGSLENLKVQHVSIITNLEPVYAIIFAAVLLQEIPTLRTIIGGVIILGTVVLAILKSKHKPIPLEH